MNYLSHEELSAKTKDELAEYAESIGLKINKVKKEENIVNDILAFQESNPVDESVDTPEEVPEQVEKIEEKTEEVSKPETKEISTQTEPSMSVGQNDFLQAIASVMKQSAPQVHTNRGINLLKTEKGKAVFAKMKKESEQYVLIKLHKNNQRMSGEKYVMFDIGNEIFSISWSIRLGFAWYVPKLLIPFIKQRTYQKFEMSEEADRPVMVGGGDAQKQVNYKPQIVSEYTLEILEDKGETREQILHRRAKKEAIPAHMTGDELTEFIHNAVRI